MGIYMKFKIGDKIKNKDRESYAKITKCTETDYYLVFEDESYGYFDFDFIDDLFEYSRIVNNKINRKLYPKYREEGKYLIRTEL